MADTPLPHDRLQPYLLDRLRDDQPGAAVETREHRVMTMQRFREAVLRDLSWLLNARCQPPEAGLSAFPLAERSVLNFGLPDLSGSTARHLSPAEVEQMIRHVIEVYEPRIIRGSLTVRAVPPAGPAAAPADGSPGGPGHLLALEIRAHVWALPVPEALYVRTEVDLESGDYLLRDQHG